MVEVRADKRVGKFEFSVAESKPTTESQARWDRRVEALAAWLLAQWQRGRSEG